MKVTVIEDTTLNKDEIILNCYTHSPEISKIKTYAEQITSAIIGSENSKQYIFHADEIYYFESVDKQTFLYTESKVLKCPSRLYELEEKLLEQSFVRISKSTLVNLLKIKSIRPLINRNLCIELKNKENVICSRRYVEGLKKSLEKGRSL